MYYSSREEAYASLKERVQRDWRGKPQHEREYILGKNANETRYRNALNERFWETVGSICSRGDPLSRKLRTRPCPMSANRILKLNRWKTLCTQ
jgi:hypothetical protein